MARYWMGLFVVLLAFTFVASKPWGFNKKDKKQEQAADTEVQAENLEVFVETGGNYVSDGSGSKNSLAMSGSSKRTGNNNEGRAVKGSSTDEDVSSVKINIHGGEESQKSDTNSAQTKVEANKGAFGRFGNLYGGLSNVSPLKAAHEVVGGLSKVSPLKAAQDVVGGLSNVSPLKTAQDVVGGLSNVSPLKTAQDVVGGLSKVSPLKTAQDMVGGLSNVSPLKAAQDVVGGLSKVSPLKAAQSVYEGLSEGAPLKGVQEGLQALAGKSETSDANNPLKISKRNKLYLSLLKIPLNMLLHRTDLFTEVMKVGMEHSPLKLKLK